MELSKTLFFVVVISALMVNAEEIHREGRCNNRKSMGRQNQKQKVHFRKPYPLLHHDVRKVNGKKDVFPKGKPNDETVSFAHANSNGKVELQKPHQKHVLSQQENEDPFNMFLYGDELIKDPMEIPSTFGISPRLSISADGEVTTFGRSLAFNKKKSFQDDSIVEYNQAQEHIMEEDHDHFHKIRTARSTQVNKKNPQQLASTLGQLQGTYTQQGVDVHNSAHAGDNFLLQASGDEIHASNQGSSAAQGSGTVSSSGSTTITNSNSGWKEQ